MRPKIELGHSTALKTHLQYVIKKELRQNMWSNNSYLRVFGIIGGAKIRFLKSK